MRKFLFSLAILPAVAFAQTSEWRKIHERPDGTQTFLETGFIFNQEGGKYRSAKFQIDYATPTTSASGKKASKEVITAWFDCKDNGFKILYYTALDGADKVVQDSAPQEASWKKVDSDSYVGPVLKAVCSAKARL